jgi:hypothetical protein
VAGPEGLRLGTWTLTAMPPVVRVLAIPRTRNAGNRALKPALQPRPAQLSSVRCWSGTCERVDACAHRRPGGPPREVFVVAARRSAARVAFEGFTQGRTETGGRKRQRKG